MKISKPIFAFLLIIAFTSCSDREFLTEGDYFHLSNDGAKLPVWVKGNMGSDVLLITVHGGPGASGHEFPLSNGFKYLENDYAIAYWDQRFSGMAQGHPDISTINLDQFVEDTRQIVTLLQHKYPGKKLFMLGHSFGGALSAAYLGQDENFRMFEGWIDLDGSIYGDLESQIMKDWILNQVPAEMNKPGADKEFWEYVLEYYEKNPNPLNYTDAEPYLFADALNGYTWDWEQTQIDNPIPYKELIFHSMFSLSFYVYSFGGNLEWVDHLNMTPELEQITIPALLLWGKNDGAVPATVADYVYDHLKTDSTMKEIVKLDECSHSPHYDQPEQFYDHVKRFIEKYK